MSVEFTLRKFPATGDLKDECGLPFACIVQPFARTNVTSLDRPCAVKAKDVARCGDCYAYINRHCLLERCGWACSLCGAYNDHHVVEQQARYGTETGVRDAWELCADIVEVECDPREALEESDSEDEDAGPRREPTAPPATPVYLALVDVCCREEVLELTRSALQAGLEALPSAALFGLITYSRRLGLYEVTGGRPSVRYVRLAIDEGGAPTAMELEDALPLGALLAPVGMAKDAIVAVLDAMQPEPFESPPDGEPEQLAGGRNFGAAMQAVLRYLSGAAALQERVRSGASASTSSSQPAADGNAAFLAGSYAGARLLAFLAGPPNAGRGHVFHRQQAQQQHGEAGPTASSIIMDPMMSDLNPCVAVESDHLWNAEPSKQ